MTATTGGFQGATWRDRLRPSDQRVHPLLARMSLEEKVGQLGSRWLGNPPSTYLHPSLGSDAPRTSTLDPRSRFPFRVGR